MFASLPAGSPRISLKRVFSLRFTRFCLPQKLQKKKDFMHNIRKTPKIMTKSCYLNGFKARPLRIFFDILLRRMPDVGR